MNVPHKDLQAVVFVVEDDLKINRLIVDYLTLAGYSTHSFFDGQLALEAITALKPDLLILDIMLPTLDGMQICQSVRAMREPYLAYRHMPIIMLTARVEESDILQGLEIGADDYLCKPFSPKELVARVKALLRRSSLNEAPLVATVAKLSLDKAQMALFCNGTVIALTHAEFQLMQLLMDNPNRVFSRAQMLDQLHTDFSDTTDRAIDSCKETTDHIPLRSHALFRARAEIKAIMASFSTYGI